MRKHYHNSNYGMKVEKFVVPTLAEIINLFDKLRRNGRIFRVDFIKREDGSTRTMLCRFGVKKHLKGGKATYDAGDKGLFFVYDTNKQGPRSFAIDNVVCVKSGGVVYWFNAGKVEPGTYPADILEENGIRTIPASTSPLLEPMTA